MRDRGFVPRLLLARDLSENDEAPLSPAQTHYLRRVLRLREGDAARVFDGEGAEREAIIVADKRAWNLKIGAAATSADARFPVVVAQIAGGGARGDWAVEKMCEVGVAAFAPLYRQKPPREAALARWRRIVAAACAQCGRAKLMRIEPPQTFAEWIARAGGDSEARFLLTPEAETPLLIATREAIAARKTIATSETPPECDSATLLLGGEDGFSPEEKQSARENGFVFAALGGRVLRFETAPAIAAALLLAQIEIERETAAAKNRQSVV